MPSSDASADAARARAACGLAVALALGLGLCGVDWGLPGPERFAAMPQRLRGDAGFAKGLAEAWTKLYAEIEKSHKELAGEEPVTYVKGVEVFKPGWSWPPDQLMNSFRSFLLRTEHPDEQKSFVVLAQMRPWSRDFKPLYLEYGGAFIYPLGAWLWFWSKLGAVSLVSDVKHYLVHPGEMGSLFLWARLYVVLFHVATVALVFRLARRLAGVNAGFAAAALYALLPMAATQTHIVKPHAVAAFWLLAAVDAASAGGFLLSGLFAGIAAGANFSLGAFMALPFLLCRSRSDVKRAVGGFALAVAVFCALNPYVIYSPKDYLWETTVYGAGGGGGASIRGLLALLGPRFASAVGAPLLVLAALGLFRRGKEPGEDVVAWSLGLGLAYLWLGLALLWHFSTGPGAARFFYALYPLMAVLGVVWAARAKIPAWLGALLLLAAFADAGRRSLVYLENMRSETTRSQAAAWVEQNVPAGSSLGLTRYPQPATTPPIRFDRYKLVIFSDPALLDKKTRPERVLTDESGKSMMKGWEVEAEFQPLLTNISPIQDDSFFANAPMYVLRAPK